MCVKQINQVKQLKLAELSQYIIICVVLYEDFTVRTMLYQVEYGDTADIYMFCEIGLTTSSVYESILTGVST